MYTGLCRSKLALQFYKYVGLYLIAFLSLNTASFAGTLSLPMNIVGQTYTFTALNSKNSENSHAGMTYKMHFNQKDYTYEISHQKIHGNYTYRLLDAENGIALITCHELYDNKPSHYSLLLKAKNIPQGLYIYQQTIPEQRMNFGDYFLG